MPSSSGSSQAQNSVTEQRKEKRMLSNRESARRSRVRKQKHLDDLLSQVGCLRRENNQILSALNATTLHYLGVEAENSVMRMRMMELGSRLQSLQKAIHWMNAGSASGSFSTSAADDGLLRPWNAVLVSQGMMGSDVFQYC